MSTYYSIFPRYTGLRGENKTNPYVSGAIDFYQYFLSGFLIFGSKKIKVFSLSIF